MALFDIFRGTEEELMRKKLHAGYAYFCEDTGKFFIDISDGEDGTETDLYRIPINSKAANGLFVDDSFIEAESFATLKDVSDATSQAFVATLAANGWQGNEAPFTYNYINSDLKCGINENIPPIIACTQNIDEYTYIDSAIATPGSGIVFSAEKKPESNIVITITDIG